ncbi:putative TBC1 domain family member 20 [Blattamonas nauphoetae]|uniref:TBC1 domain family member 20 n=1 Tax=Blattamonas nauphoetae TaxID=2049346 RepID=A0ABQ9YCA5_9EUKA|nr:putative TBC1 domain family member 20 [Blattamonas nauphoetae]
MAEEVISLVSQDLIDTAKLKEIGEETGFFNSQLRQIVWPLLLNTSLTSDSKWIEQCSLIPGPHPKTLPITHSAPSLASREQIYLDGIRSFVFLDNEPALKYELQSDLIATINQVHSQNQKIRYFQGYSDISSVFLRIFGVVYAPSLLQAVSHNFLCYAHEPTFTRLLHYMEFIFPLIAFYDFSFYKALIQSEVSVHVCISPVITWFTHDYIDADSSLVERIYDFILSTHPLAPLYICSALLLHSDIANTLFSQKIPLEFADVHTFLSNNLKVIPSQEKMESILHSARQMMKDFPPSILFNSKKDALSDCWESVTKREKDKRRSRKFEWLGSDEVRSLLNGKHVHQATGKSIHFLPEPVECPIHALTYPSYKIPLGFSIRHNPFHSGLHHARNSSRTHSIPQTPLVRPFRDPQNSYAAVSSRISADSVSEFQRTLHSDLKEDVSSTVEMQQLYGNSKSGVTPTAHIVTSSKIGTFEQKKLNTYLAKLPYAWEEYNERVNERKEGSGRITQTKKAKTIQSPNITQKDPADTGDGPQKDRKSIMSTEQAVKVAIFVVVLIGTLMWLKRHQ